MRGEPGGPERAGGGGPFSLGESLAKQIVANGAPVVLASLESMTAADSCCVSAGVGSPDAAASGFPFDAAAHAFDALGKVRGSALTHVMPAELGAANGVRLVLASVLPVSAYHVAPGSVPQTVRRPPTRINMLNTWIKSYAATHKHVYLDYFSAMVDDKGMLRAELSEDDLHPNARGYAIMVPLAEAAIAQALR